MKTVLLALCLGGTAFAQELKDPSLPPVEWLETRRHAPLKLVEKGELNFAIVGEFKAEAAVRGPEGQQLAAKGRDAVRRGANELVDAVKRAFGKEPLVCEPDDPRVSEFPYVIALGETVHSRALGVDPAKLPREGFEVRTFEKGVVIVGRDGFRVPGEYDVFNWRCGRLTCNGTEWGAVDFAERVFGVRYFSTKDKDLWTYVPDAKDVTLRPAAWRDWPRYKFRGSPHEHKRVAISTDFFGGEAPNPMVLAKAHPDKIETIFYRDSHGRLWHDPKTYVNNYFDVTNPELADILVDDFRDYFAKNGVGTYWGQTWAPSSRYIWFGQCDSGHHMDNERARKWVRESAVGCDTESEIYGEFYRILGEKCRVAFPDHTLVLMAYSNYLLAPRRQEKLPDNVHILACIGTPVYIRSAKYRADLAEVYGGWNRLMSKGRKCVAYTYDLGYQKDALIPQTIRGWYEGDFLRTMAPHISQDVVYPCNYGHGNSNYASSYLTYRCLWNPGYDVAAGLRDYFEKTCGKVSGGELYAFYRLLVSAWEERMVPTVTNGKSCIPSPNYKLMYSKVYTEDIVNRLIAHLDAAERALPSDAAFRKRFDNFAEPFRRVLPDILAYQRITVPNASAASAAGPIVVDGVPNEASWTAAKPPKFHRAFAGGGDVVSPDCRLLWDDKGLYLSVDSPAPYKPGKGLWDGDSFEFMVAGGDPDRPANLYQFVLCANGQFEDLHMPLDQPRPIDSSWTAVGCEHKTVMSDKGWTGEIFVPWTALKDAAPKKGDVWRMNLISNRWEPKEKATAFTPAEYSSWAATLNNNRTHDLYARVTFE